MPEQSSGFFVLNSKDLVYLFFAGTIGFSLAMAINWSKESAFDKTKNTAKQKTIENNEYHPRQETLNNAQNSTVAPPEINNQASIGVQQNTGGIHDGPLREGLSAPLSEHTNVESVALRQQSTTKDPGTKDAGGKDLKQGLTQTQGNTGGQRYDTLLNEYKNYKSNITYPWGTRDKSMLIHLEDAYRNLNRIASSSNTLTDIEQALRNQIGHAYRAATQSTPSDNQKGTKMELATHLISYPYSASFLSPQQIDNLRATIEKLNNQSRTPIDGTATPSTGFGTAAPGYAPGHMPVDQIQQDSMIANPYLQFTPSPPPATRPSIQSDKATAKQ